MAQNAHSRREIRPAKANAAKRAIVESLEQGASRQGACEAAQVARRTFYNWLAEDEACRARGRGRSAGRQDDGVGGVRLRVESREGSTLSAECVPVAGAAGRMAAFDGEQGVRPDTVHR